MQKQLWFICLLSNAAMVNTPTAVWVLTACTNNGISSVAAHSRASLSPEGQNFYSRNRKPFI